MLRSVNWLGRVLGFAWLGLLAFVIAPPTGRSGRPVPFAEPVQVAGYCLLGAGFVAWALVDVHPGLARHRARALAVILGVIAAAAGFASAAGGGGTAMVAFGFVATVVAGGDLDLAPALAVAAAGVLAIEVSGLAFGSGYGALLGLPAIAASGLLVGRNRGVYRVQAEQAALLLAQREQLEAEQRRADLLDERARIAREIHDVLAHSLGALGIQIQAARSVLHKDPDRAGEFLAAAQQMAAEGLTETRRAVHALRTDTLPLGEELARATDAYAQRYGVAVSFDTGGVPAALPPDATVALLRIAQEALVNAAKHAAGQGVTVRLDYGDADVRLTVRNDLGPGAGAGDPADVSTVNGGYGLTGMRERLRLLNGTLEAGSRDGQWIVTAELPRPGAPQPETMTS
ncbi:MAG TPA: sensor histidine kinase [Streptosporangiaceae bacterium]|nr:sensor histidine kinase [Streptosporangiaceae bacterium]